MNRIAVASRAILVVVLVSSACGPSGSSDDNESASNQEEGDYAQVSAGTSNTCALEKTGEAVCWGALKDREDLQIPDGPFMDLDVGRGFACAIAEETGEVSCWGIYRSSFPVSGGSFVDVEAGRSYACGLREDGSLECWNWREDEGRITSPPSSGDFEKLSVTGAQGCAIDSDGQIQCWGYIGREDYRDPVRELQPEPPFSGAARSVCAGWETNCAVKSEDGILECWPNSLSGADQPRDAFEQVSCGESWSSQTNCGVTEDGHIACWGARLHDLVRS